MADHQGNDRNGRNVALPDENRPSWSPQDDYATRRHGRHRDRGDERYARHWEDRDERWRSEDEWHGHGGDRYGSERYMQDRPDRDRQERYERYAPERYGQGQSGYAAGRLEGDRAYQSGNQGYPGSFEDRSRGLDDRWSGRGGPAWEREREHERSRNIYTGNRQNLGVGSSMPTGPQAWSPTGERGMYGGHRGKGPKGYQRSDERIREMVCEALLEHDGIDASEIEVSVSGGEVTLKGSVEHRQQKRLAEDAVEQVGGVKDIHNQIRIAMRSEDHRS